MSDPAIPAEMVVNGLTEAQLIQAVNHVLGEARKRARMVELVQVRHDLRFRSQRGVDYLVVPAIGLPAPALGFRSILKRRSGSLRFGYLPGGEAGPGAETVLMPPESEIPWVVPSVEGLAAYAGDAVDRGVLGDRIQEEVGVTVGPKPMLWNPRREEWRPLVA